MQALKGITVISLEQAIAAPFATRQLADLGARVIKIERPESGDFARHYDERVNGLCSHFAWVNRSKESLTLDVKHAEAAPIFEALLESADVLVQNLAPGAAQRLGLDYPTLSKRYPKLIVCDISGYGGDGPYRDKKAYDLLVQSEAGFLSVSGTPDEMTKAGCSIADIAAGMYAYTNILAALIERGQTGHGKHIDISMLESMVEWMSFPLYYAYAGATPPPRAGAAHATIYPYGPFPVRDGTIMLGLQNEREWVSFCELVLGKPQLAVNPAFSTNALRNANREQLREQIVQVFGDLSSELVMARLDQAKIANARVNDMAAVWNHPQLQARDRWRSVDTENGSIPALLAPGQTDTCMKPIPALGQHTDQILRQIGLDSDRIGALRSQGAV